ncbi:MAG: MotA/TolQ/ExbB proton channel family protein [Zetaproteobacteria bacterium]|nr:MAG: MotA/TolQ/ExbB proton channel family protein [Zetaproteobacteria bacterium]
MYILLLASIVALTIIIERAWSLRRSAVIPLDDVQGVELAVRSGDVQRAHQLCRQQDTPMGRILTVALANSGVKRSVLKEIIEETGRQEVARMERFINILGIIAATAPLLGLLGTVVGMIEVFHQISLVGVGKADVLAGGISMALNTTAMGLSVAIPSLVAYRFFDARVDRFVVEIEQHAIRFVELLKGDRG